MRQIKTTHSIDSKQNFTRKSLLSICIATALLAGCTTSNEQVQKNSEKVAKHEKTVAKTHKSESNANKIIIAEQEGALDSSYEENLGIGSAAVTMNASPGKPVAMGDIRQRVQSKVMAFAPAQLSRPALQMPYPGTIESNTESYQNLDENGVKVVTEEPVSTFSIDVDTASYSNVRRMINQGMLPPADAVRTEEFVNYFDYGYETPSASQPFSLLTDIAVSPWNQKRHLMRIAVKGFEPEKAEIPGANLVFLLDVSGSMNSPNKLPLLKRSLKMLTQQLSAKDSVSIVVYAGASGVVLEPTSGDDHFAINQALEQLSAGGSTNGASGIELAYSMAQKAFIKDGINRVILATDGDFNVGLTNHEQLIELIERKRESGIALSVLGFGQGNYNDHLTEQLADAGNGNAAYIDNINEARKVLVDELQSTLQTIAKDVKIQVEFNPNVVSEYRLIGYENRHLNREDFNNDKVDAGEIGAGHTVTAFYEVTLKGSGGEYVDELRYQINEAQTAPIANEQELAFLKVRYKAPGGSSSKLLSQPIMKHQITKFQEADSDFKFASSVVGFASVLRQSNYTQDIDSQWLIDNAVNNKGVDNYGYRAEFTQLMRNYFAMNHVIGKNQSGGNLSKDYDELIDTGVVTTIKHEGVIVKAPAIKPVLYKQ